jgi:hypothetical protein
MITCKQRKFIEKAAKPKRRERNIPKKNVPVGVMVIKRSPLDVNAGWSSD